MLFFTVFRPIKLRKTRYKPFESCIVHQFYFPQKVLTFWGFLLFGFFRSVKSFILLLCLEWISSLSIREDIPLFLSINK